MFHLGKNAPNDLKEQLEPALGVTVCLAPLREANAVIPKEVRASKLFPESF